MTTLAREFDASTTKIVDFTPVPAGRYTAYIVKTEMRSTKSGNGKYLALTLEVTTGDHKGRKFWDNLNLENPSTQAVEIAESTLAKICNSVGKIKIKDGDELLFAELDVVLATEHSLGFSPKNVVKDYMKVGAETGTTKGMENSDLPI